MPLRAIGDSERQLRELTRKLRAGTAATATIERVIAEALPDLAGEQLKRRESPTGARWAKNRRPGRSHTNILNSLKVHQGRMTIKVTSDHPGAGPLNYGRGEFRIKSISKRGTASVSRTQPARPYLPLAGLPTRWKERLLRLGMGALSYYLGRFRRWRL